MSRAKPKKPTHISTSTTNEDTQAAQSSGQTNNAAFYAMFDNVPVMVDAFDKTGRCLFWNKGCERFLGWTKQEIMAVENGLALLYPDQAAFDRVVKNIQEGDAEFAECEVRAKDGTIRTQLWSNFHLPNGQTFAIGHDITGQKQAERALKAANASLEASRDALDRVLQQLPIGIQVFDTNGLCTDVNHTHCQIFNIQADKLIGKYNILADPLAEKSGTAAGARRALQGEMVDLGDLVFEFGTEGTPFTGRTGERTINVLFVPIVDEHGNVLRIVAANQDVTERRKAERDTVALTIERDRVQVLRDFINDVSHDFKTPLSVINTKAYLINLEQDQTRRAGHAEILQAQVKHLTRLIDDLLTMARLDKADEGSVRAFDVNRLVVDVEEAMGTLAATRHIKLEMRLGAGLPPIAGNVKELYRALANITQNALTYTPKEGSVTITTLLEDEMVVVKVKDTGIGISTADLPHIFERFFRAERARTTSGTGLGLAIAYKIVRSHGGRIEVESELNVGSTFYIMLPSLKSE